MKSLSSVELETDAEVDRSTYEGTVHDERVQLLDQADGSGQRLIEVSPVEFQFRDIQYSVEGKQILKGISGYLPPKKMLAIMVRNA